VRERILISSGTAQVISSTDPKNPVGSQWWETSRVSANLWTTYGVAPKAAKGWRVRRGINYRCVQPPMNYTNLFNRRYFSYIFLKNPDPGTTCAYAGHTYGFDFRLCGDPRLLTSALKVEF